MEASTVWSALTASVFAGVPSLFASCALRARTAAWVRTGLAALASGVGAKKLLEGVVPEWMIWGVGTILVLFSAFSFGAAVWRQVFPGTPPPTLALVPVPT